MAWWTKVDIQKWRNLSAADKRALAGTITPIGSSFLDGGARVEIKGTKS